MVGRSPFSGSTGGDPERRGSLDGSSAGSAPPPRSFRRDAVAGLVCGAWLAVACGVLGELVAPLGGRPLGLYELTLVPIDPLGLSSLAQLVLLYASVGAALGLVVALVARAQLTRRWAIPWLVAGASIALTVVARASTAETIARAAAATLVAVAAIALESSGWFTSRARGWPAIATAGGGLGLALAISVAGPTAWRVAQAALDPGPGAAQESPRPDVLLVVLDTTRADRLSSYGYRRPTTPNLDRLASEGTLFERAYAAAPWTLPSHASLFTGVDVAVHGAGWEHRHLDDRFETLATRLRELGYATVGISENPFIGPTTGFAKGFDDFFEMYGYGRRSVAVRILDHVGHRLHGRHEDDGHTAASLETLRGWLTSHRGRGRPVFAFVNLMAAHLPDYPRADWPPQRRDFTATDVAKLERIGLSPDRFFLDGEALDARQLALLGDFYDGDLHHLDTALGELAEWMRRTGRLDRTLLVVTADHGENLGDHGFLEHQYCLYDSLLHVPLIVRYPRAVPAGRRVTEAVSTTDLADTIVDLVAPSPSLTSLLAPTRRAALFAETSRVPFSEVRTAVGNDFVAAAYTRFPERLESVRAGGYKLIEGSDGSRQLFQVDTDPGETHDLSRAEPEVAGQLANLLERHRGRGGSPTAAPRIAIDPVAHEVMQALGYVR